MTLTNSLTHSLPLLLSPARLLVSSYWSSALLGAFASIPLCFHFQTALWFNEHYVTTEVPPKEDLETILEVGSWTWNWMEPPLGQVSFFLLALQVRFTIYVKETPSPHARHIC